MHAKFPASAAAILAVLLLIQLDSPGVYSANVLFYFGLSGHSHISSVWPVIQTLAERGHNVTVLTPMLPRSSHPKVNVVHAVELFNVFKDNWDEDGDLLGVRVAGKHRELWDDVVSNAIKTCAALFESPAARAVIYDSKFDLVIMDTAFNDCAFALAYYQYKCPYILYSALSVWVTHFDDLGLQVESSSIPDMEVASRTPMSFFERLVATWQPLRWTLSRRLSYYPALSAILQEKLGLSEAPNFLEVYAKTSLVLMNTHYSNDYSRSLPPLFVSIAGIGIQEERKSLPEDLEKFVTKPGSKGFIYVSFGTVVRISKSNGDVRRKFFSVFGNMSEYQFVWKWEEDLPDKVEIPKNIHFVKWVPQQDLLAHNNIRGFVSHGGMNGINEAVYHGVPMVIFPIMGDQDYNGNMLASKGVAVTLEIADFTRQDLKNALDTILYDKELRGRVSKASTIFRDRPMKPLETAIWWIEFVLRHGDTSFLMSESVNQSWYERRLLDVWFFVFTIVSATFMVVLLLVAQFLSVVFRAKSVPRPQRPQPRTRSKLKEN